MGLVTLAIMPSPSSLLIPSLDDDDLLGLDRRRDLEDWREDFFAGLKDSLKVDSELEKTFSKEKNLHFFWNK